MEQLFAVNPSFKNELPLKKWRRLLEKTIVSVDGYEIASYRYITGQKPIALLLHGMGGNYFGLTPLAYELLPQFDIVICELPGHGASSLKALTETSSLQVFYSVLIQELSQLGEIGLVIGHSFSTYLISDSRLSHKIPTVVINPVYQPSKACLRGIQLSSKSQAVMLFSNLPLLSPVRALFLEKVFSREALINIWSDALRCHNSIPKLRAQKQMIPLSIEADNIPKDNGVCLAFLGEKDGLVAPFDATIFKEYFPKALPIRMNAGHLLPLEKAKDIAQEILNHLFLEENEKM